MSERQDFPEWAVKRVYLLQEGICTSCGNPLENGFHRHHKDGNPANNSDDNLELLCPECHYARKYEHDKETMGEDEAVNLYEEHKKVERAMFKKIVEMIDLGMEKQLSGAAMERLMDASVKALQISRREKELDKVEYPPSEIKILLSKNIELQKLEEYIRGVKDGVKMMRIEMSESGD